jgi:sirohydrochlorin cobaltochelatase
MTHREIVLIGHGSRLAEGVSQFRRFAAHFSDYVGEEVGVCFLELSEPDILDGLAEAARRARAGGEVIAVPMFLGTAYHMKAEINGAICHIREDFPGTLIRLASSLGFHLKLAELLKVRVDEALASTSGALPAGETTVLVVGGGSSDPDSNSAVSKTARVLAEIGDYAGVEYAYQRVAHPRTAEGIVRCQQLGAKQIVMVPYLLFTGIVRQNTDIAAQGAAGEIDVPVIHADPLGPDHPLLMEVAAQRLREASDGLSALLRERMVEGFPQTIMPGDHHHEHERER